MPSPSPSRPVRRSRAARRAVVARLRAIAVPVVAVATLAAPGGAGAQRATADVRYAFRVETGDGEPVRGVTYVSGDRSRIDLLARDGRPGRDYLLVTDGGRTFTAVNPRDREYSVTTADQFARLMSTAMGAATAVLTLEVEDLAVGGQRLGAGERMAGQATERSRLTADYALRIGAMGFTTRQRHHLDVEYHVAPALALPRNPVLELMATLPTVLAQADEDFVARLQAGRRALVGEGTPLRTTLTARETDDKGKVSTKRTTIEITDLAREAQSPARFTVPAGYRKRDGFQFSVGTPER